MNTSLFSESLRLRTKRRLLKRIKIVPETECWEWTGWRDRDGYGGIKFNRKNARVHRLAAWIWLDFDLSSELFVCHKCDNPLCFNPKHLFLATCLENNRDSISKGRGGAGKANRLKEFCPYGHKYTEENTYITPEGNRVCRSCWKMHKSRYMMRKARGNYGYI